MSSPMASSVEPPPHLIHRLHDLHRQLRDILALSEVTAFDEAARDLFLVAAEDAEDLRNKANAVWDEVLYHLPPAEVTSPHADIISECRRTCVTIRQLRKRLSPSSVSSSSSSSDHPVRFAPIQLPIFDGHFGSWPTFRDTFHSLVHSNPGLAPVEKLHHLLGSLKGTALSLVAHTPLSSDGYMRAWAALTDHFNNNRRLASFYVTSLLHGAPLASSHSSEDVDSFLRQFGDNVRSLLDLGVPDLASFLLFSLAIEKVDRTTRRAFEMEHAGTEFPSFHQLENFLRRKLHSFALSDPLPLLPPVTASSRRSSSLSTSPARPSTPPTSSAHRRDAPASTIRRLPASSPRSSEPAQGLASSSGAPQCVYCTLGHSIRQCPKFKALPVKERRKYVEKGGLCKNCMSINHPTSDCKSTQRCHQCGKSHHTILHPSSSAHPSPSEKTPSPPQPSTSVPSLEEGEERSPRRSPCPSSRTSPSPPSSPASSVVSWAPPKGRRPRRSSASSSEKSE